MSKTIITFVSGREKTMVTPPDYGRKFVSFYAGSTTYRYPYHNIFEIKEEH